MNINHIPKHTQYTACWWAPLAYTCAHSCSPDCLARKAGHLNKSLALWEPGASACDYSFVVSNNSKLMIGALCTIQNAWWQLEGRSNQEKDKTTTCWRGTECKQAEPFSCFQRRFCELWPLWRHCRQKNLWYSVKTFTTNKPEKTRHNGLNTVKTGKADTHVAW